MAPSSRDVPPGRPEVESFCLESNLFRFFPPSAFGVTPRPPQEGTINSARQSPSVSTPVRGTPEKPFPRTRTLYPTETSLRFRTYRHLHSSDPPTALLHVRSRPGNLLGRKETDRKKDGEASLHAHRGRSGTDASRRDGNGVDDLAEGWVSKNRRFSKVHAGET